MTPEVVVSAVALEGKKCKHRNSKQIRVWEWVPLFWCSLSDNRKCNCEGKAQGRKYFKTSLRENIA